MKVVGGLLLQWQGKGKDVVEDSFGWAEVVGSSICNWNKFIYGVLVSKFNQAHGRQADKLYVVECLIWSLVIDKWTHKTDNKESSTKKKLVF